MNSRKYWTIQPTRRGDFITRGFGCHDHQNRFPTLAEAQQFAREKRRAWLLKERANNKIFRETQRLEKSCSTPLRVSRQLKLQRALHDAYQGVCISGRRAAAYERYHGGQQRYLGEICNANETAETAETLYQRAAHAHHLAAEARHSGNGEAWDAALNILEQELKKFDNLNIYGINALDLD